MEAVVAGLRVQWGIANTLTAFRAFSVIFAIPLFYFGLKAELFVLVILATVTDWLDGYIARKTETLTPLGKVFDPLADKLFINTMLLAYLFVYGQLLVLGLLVCTLAYDIDNTSRRLRDIIQACMNHADFQESSPVTLLSKTKTFGLFVLVSMFYVPKEWELFPEGLLIGLTLIGILLVLASWWNNRKSSVCSFLRSAFH